MPTRYCERDKPRNALDAYLSSEGVTSQALATKIQAMRRHPTQPTVHVVGHWRTGRRKPGHDMQLFIELATGGMVTFKDWD